MWGFDENLEESVEGEMRFEGVDEFASSFPGPDESFKVSEGNMVVVEMRNGNVFKRKVISLVVMVIWQGEDDDVVECVRVDLLGSVIR